MEHKQEIVACCDGRIIPLREVGDPIFSQRLAGDGAAIIPSSSTFVSPVDGTVRLIFKGSHSMVIETQDKTNLMVHIGINTVSLNGKGFTPHVKRGDKVKRGDPLVDIDLETMKQNKVDLTTVVLVMEPRSVLNLEIKTSGEAKKNQTAIIKFNTQ